jgi:inner membrane protein
VVMTLWGRWVYLHHHRGITHSIVGALLLALLLPLLFYGAERLFARLRGKRPRFRLPGLLVASLLAMATHPLMDWTNNYGIRPFLPWSARWYYGDLVFIIDPWLWLVVGGAAFLLTSRRWWQTGFWVLLALVLTSAVILLPMRNNELNLPLVVCIGWVVGVLALIAGRLVHLRERFGSRIAITALSFILVYWGGLSFMHARAYRRAEQLAGNFAATRQENVKRLAAMPTLANPALWRCVAETDRGTTFRFNLDLKENPAPLLRDLVLYEKPAGEEALAVMVAGRDERAQIFLDFARFPVVETRGDCLTETLVQFADLRYTEPGAKGPGNFSLEVPVECPPEVGERDTKDERNGTN